MQPGYALLEAVDITDRETPSCLLNLYEGELLHRYARICTGITREDCPAFRGMFLERGTLVAAFDRSRGVAIDSLFYRGDSWKWEERMDCAELLLNKALSLANLPPEVGCAALFSDNLLFDPDNRKLEIRWMLRPLEEMNPRETALLAADQVKKILRPSPAAGPEEQQFLNELEAAAFPNVVALYGRWREAEKAMRKEREDFRRKSVVKKAFYILGRMVKRKMGRGGSR